MTPTTEYRHRRPAGLSHADEHPWPAMTRSSPELCHAARLTLSQRVIDGKLPRNELVELLGMLGLLP